MTYLSLLALNPTTRACRRDMADPQAMHKTIMSMFPQAPQGSDSARRHFGVLWRVEPADSPTLLVQSFEAPDFDKLPSNFAACRTKPIDAHLSSLMAGTVVAYRVVLNPVKNDRRSGSERRSIVASRDRPEWWSSRAQKVGLGLLDAPVLTGQRDRHVNRDGTRFPIYSVRADGTAEIRDADLLRKATVGGIGRAKAWGCGLLTVARLT